MYPQLYHWLLSFCENNKINYYNSVLKIFLWCIQGFMLFFLLNISERYLGYNVPIHIAIFGLIILYLNPFNFDSNNAKNINLSPRLLGVVIGQLFLCFIASYHITEEVIFLFLISIFIPLVIYTTQFTLQFISIIFLVHIFFFETQIIIAYLLGLLFTVAINIKYFIFYFKMQLQHKTFYSKKLADQFILKVRYSIWRDFIYDFWIKPKNKSFILYIYNNPVIQALFGFPLLIFFIINFVSNYENIYYIKNNGKVLLFFVPVLLCFFAFIITSFRRTRFLGEPQRYLEFSTPFLVVLLITNYHENILGVYLSFLLFLISLLTVYILKNKISDIKNIKEISLYKIKDYITNKSKIEKSVIFCNNLNITKKLLDTNNSFFWGMPVNEAIGNYNYKNVFDEYPIVSNDIIPELIDSFKVDTVIIDTSVKSYNKSVINNINQKIKLAVKEGPLEIYNII